MPRVYQLKITLEDIEPPIWRRILVPANITFAKLHKIIQAAFGWQDYHLYNFDFADFVIALPDPDFAPGELYGKPEKNPRKAKVDQLVQVGETFIYEYDLGDSWMHEVIVEKILEAQAGVHYPVCVDGARHRPPEDVGGTGGYEEFCRIIADKDDEEYEDMLIWAEKDTGGRKFDPEYFYLNEVNRALSRIKCGQ